MLPFLFSAALAAPHNPADYTPLATDVNLLLVSVDTDALSMGSYTGVLDNGVAVVDGTPTELGPGDVVHLPLGAVLAIDVAALNHDQQLTLHRTTQIILNRFGRPGDEMVEQLILRREAA